MEKGGRMGEIGMEQTKIASELVAENFDEFRSSFNALMAPSSGEAPEGGRIAGLERLWHKLRTDNDKVVSDYVSAMIEGIDEDEVISSKK